VGTTQALANDGDQAANKATDLRSLMSLDREPAERLVARFMSGDRAACEEVVRRDYAAVYRFLLHLTSDAELAADLTQETFRTAWEKLAQFHGRSTVKSWLHRIAYNKFVDAHRKACREQFARESMQWEAAERHELPAWRAAHARESALRLQELVQQLADDQRAVVALHYFEGFSLQETATIVEQPVGTVKWRISAALRALREVIDVESML
jgi:RNA polymerase sigma-70 factor (ECF subfamily)